MPKLYDIAAEFAAIADKLQAALEEGSEYTDYDGLAAELEESKVTLEVKVENCVRLIKNQTADAEAFKAESERLAKKQKTLEASVKWLKDYIKASMEAAKVDKLKTGLFTPRLQLNGQASVECNAKLAELPAELVRKVPEKLELDKDAVLALWKAKEALPAGIIVTQGRHVRF